MNSEIIISLINNPNQISSADVAELDRLLTEHPYFQSGQLLLTKGLLNTESIRYNRQLKKAATYSLDRKKLFSLITLQKIKKQEEKITQTEIKKEIEKDLEIGTPLEFDEDEMHFFSEWLVLSKIKKIDRKPKAQTEDLIDSFIEKNVTISKPKNETFFKSYRLHARTSPGSLLARQVLQGRPAQHSG